MSADLKAQKYDRQLRLWGEHGQQELETASVCLINATAAGTETLKNLVLPAMGSFTIVDGQKVSGADVGNNFFLSPEDLGQSRARCATAYLKELNSDVSGNFIEEDISTLLASQPKFFLQFTVVIAASVRESHLLQLASLCWEAKVPLVFVQCYGFLGWLRIAVPEHTFVEAHPETDFIDLRLDTPLPALGAWVDMLDISKMDSFAIGQQPFPVLLLAAWRAWLQSHDGQPPTTRADKDEFKAFVRKIGQSTNVDEAVAHAHRLWVPYSIPSRVAEALKDPAAADLQPASGKFWVLVRAVADFVANEGSGRLPLSGSVPDMDADTANYIRLQTIYREKAFADYEAIAQRVHSLVRSIDRPNDWILDEEIKLFCKNAHNIGFLRYRTFASEYQRESKIAQSIGGMLAMEPGSDLSYYIMLRAAQSFFELHNRFPGVFDDELDGDVGMLKRCVQEVCAHIGLATQPTDDQVFEMCRYGASEPHAVAAVMGGVAAQEIIKLITHQFVPVNNSFIFNGASGTALSHAL